MAAASRCASRRRGRLLPPEEKAPAPLQPPACLFSSAAALCCCCRCTAVPSRPLSPSPFLLLLLLPIYRLLTLLFHQSESSRCNSNTCCTNMKIANAVSDGWCWLPWSDCDPSLIAAGLCLVVPPWRRGEALLPRVPVRRSPPQLRPQPEDREECTEPVQQWTRQFGLLGIRSGLCTRLQD